MLVNNAIKLDVSTAEGDLPSARAVSNACFNNGITSNAIVTRAFTPLLRKSANPRVVMVSSTRGSMGRTASRQVRRLPPLPFPSPLGGARSRDLVASRKRETH